MLFLFKEGILAKSIILKSLLETIKWLLIWLTVAGLVLGVLSQGLIFDTSDGLDVLLIIALLMFQHRLKFDEHNNQIDIKLGAYFFKKEIFTYSHHTIDTNSINTISFRADKAINIIDINYTSVQGKLSTYTFRCFKQAKQAQLVVNKLLTVERVYTAKREETEAAKTNSATVSKFTKIFPQHTILGNAEAKNNIPILRCALPLPDSKKNLVHFIVVCFALLTLFIAFSSQNWKASFAFLVITYASYYFARVIVCNKYYFIKTAPLSSIIINDDELFLPALLFTDKTPRTLTKQEIISIEAKWNYDYKSVEGSARKTKRSYLISLVFNTSKGQSISLTHWSVDSEELVFSLLKHKYPVSIDRTSQMVYPFKRHVGLFVCLFILIILATALPKVISL
ncbi:Bacterial membrane flanked domain protein [Pseudoalteromonas distincta]